MIMVKSVLTGFPLHVFHIHRWQEESKLLEVDLIPGHQTYRPSSTPGTTWILNNMHVNLGTPEPGTMDWVEGRRQGEEFQEHNGYIFFTEPSLFLSMPHPPGKGELHIFS